MSCSSSSASCTCAGSACQQSPAGLVSCLQNCLWQLCACLLAFSDWQVGRTDMSGMRSPHLHCWLPGLWLQRQEKGKDACQPQGFYGPLTDKDVKVRGNSSCSSSRVAVTAQIICPITAWRPHRWKSGCVLGT
jgi:hypothetical protein